jgi:toxin ParE1/3/4
MRTYQVQFSPEFADQLEAVYEFVAEAASSSEIARRYTEAIVVYCEGLCASPHRGTRRDEIRPGLRITNYKGNAVIAFTVDDADGLVLVLGLFYAGQDWQAYLGS